MNGSHQMLPYTKSLLGVGKSAFSRFENVNQGSKNHFRRSENTNRGSKTHFRRSENADRGSKTHFRCSENAIRESKTHFRHSENANRGSKTISDAPDTVFRCQRYLNCPTVFNQLDRLQLAETIIPNIVTLLNFEQPENIALKQKNSMPCIELCKALS